MRLDALKNWLLARRAHRGKKRAEPILDDAEQRQDLLKRIVAGISANKFPPR
jgi:hypothetical protein